MQNEQTDVKDRVWLILVHINQVKVSGNVPETVPEECATTCSLSLLRVLIKNIKHYDENINDDNENINDDNENINHDKENINDDNENLNHDNENINHDNENINHDNENINHHDKK